MMVCPPNIVEVIRDYIYHDNYDGLLKSCRLMHLSEMTGGSVDPVALGMIRDHLTKNGVPEWYMHGHAALCIVKGFGSLSYEYLDELRDLYSNQSPGHDVMDLVGKLVIHSTPKMLGVDVLDDCTFFTYKRVSFRDNSRVNLGVRLNFSGEMRVKCRPLENSVYPVSYLEYDIVRKTITNVVWDLPISSQFNYRKLTPVLNEVSSYLGDETYFDHLKDDLGEVVRYSAL